MQVINYVDVKWPIAYLEAKCTVVHREMLMFSNTQIITEDKACESSSQVHREGSFEFRCNPYEVI